MEYGSIGITGPFRHAVHFFILVSLLALSQLDTAASQSMYTWAVGPFGECEYDGRTKCGPGGKQYREVWCTVRTGTAVLDENCLIDFKPPGGRECAKKCMSSGKVMLKKPYDGESDNDRDYNPEHSDYDNQGRGYTEAGRWNYDTGGAEKDVLGGAEYGGRPPV
ncbi:thrombospondin type-1 domain-containing protein 7A, partial [Aplysia californica]|uniref:Thrombospondin type-1 domain-containing protein 7A n=1 Tax=Aplysia californica TaxID=6500 RepID=A0ABM0ZVH9_APLCA